MDVVIIISSSCEYCEEFRINGWNYCGNCSKALSDLCPECGDAIRMGLYKCPECGIVQIPLKEEHIL